MVVLALLLKITEARADLPGGNCLLYNAWAAQGHEAATHEWFTMELQGHSLRSTARARHPQSTTGANLNPMRDNSNHLGAKSPNVDEFGPNKADIDSEFDHCGAAFNQIRSRFGLNQFCA